MEKPIIWMGQSRKILRRMPEDVKDEVGYNLDLVQRGRRPAGAKRMKGDLRDVIEIRIDYDTDTYRAMYTTKFEGVVYVPDAFKKKSKSGIQTPTTYLDRLRRRLKDALTHYEDYKHSL